MNIDEINRITLYRTDAPAGTQKSNRWFSWYRPRSYWDVAVPHLLLAMITGIPLLLSFLLPLKHLSLIPCTMLWFTGYPCPFCGFTRSFWAISAGDWSYALWNAPLSGFVYIIIVAVFIWNAAALFAGIRIKPGEALRLSRLQSRWFIAFISVLFLLNWIYRLSLGLK
jgi:hypothetical protein